MLTILVISTWFVVWLTEIDFFSESIVSNVFCCVLAEENQEIFSERCSFISGVLQWKYIWKYIWKQIYFYSVAVLVYYSTRRPCRVFLSSLVVFVKGNLLEWVKLFSREILWWVGNFLGVSFPRGQLSSGAIVLEAIIQGAIIRGAIFPWRNCPDTFSNLDVYKKTCKHFLLTILWFNNRYLTTEPKLTFAVIYLKTKTAVHTKSSSGSIDRGAIIQGEIIQGSIIRKTIIQGSIFLEPSKSCFNVILILTLQFKIWWRY